MQDTIEIRVTRPRFYPADCNNPEFQQGYYFTGIDFDDAREKAKEKFPSEQLNIKISRRLINNSWVKDDKGW